jgi:histidine triad (HIT) family protein
MLAVDERTVFEKIIAHEIQAEVLMENDFALVIRDINPQAPTHVLLIPKKKIGRIADSSDVDCELLGALLLMARDFAQKNGLNSFRLIINNGLQAGETVPYLHVHLLSGRPMAWPPG